MDKNILIKLSELADELDSNHLYKEANIVTETMTRMAQEMGDEKPWWQTPPPEKPYGIDPLITENTKLRDQISALDYYVKFLLDLLKASNKRQDAERIEKMVGRFLVDESREASSSNDMTRIAQAYTGKGSTTEFQVKQQEAKQKLEREKEYQNIISYAKNSLYENNNLKPEEKIRILNNYINDKFKLSLLNDEQKQALQRQWDNVKAVYLTEVKSNVGRAQALAIGESPSTALMNVEGPAQTLIARLLPTSGSGKKMQNMNAVDVERMKSAINSSNVHPAVKERALAILSTSTAGLTKVAPTSISSQALR